MRRLLFGLFILLFSWRTLAGGSYGEAMDNYNRYSNNPYAAGVTSYVAPVISGGGERSTADYMEDIHLDLPNESCKGLLDQLCLKSKEDCAEISGRIHDIKNQEVSSGEREKITDVSSSCSKIKPYTVGLVSCSDMVPKKYVSGYISQAASEIDSSGSDDSDVHSCLKAVYQKHYSKDLDKNIQEAMGKTRSPASVTRTVTASAAK